jgi:hypothetical protein
MLETIYPPKVQLSGPSIAEHDLLRGQAAAFPPHPDRVILGPGRIRYTVFPDGLAETKIMFGCHIAYRH